MLSVIFQKYTKTCTSVAGGVSRLWLFDPADFDFTMTTTGAAPVLSVKQYTVIARRAGATFAGGALMFSVPIIAEEAMRTGKQSSRKGCSTRWEHELTFQLAQLTKELTAYLQHLSDASCCAGIGCIIEHFDGKVFVMGETYVNTVSIPRFYAYMDGAETESGKVMDDFNGVTVKIKSAYTRELHEYTGAISVVIGFETA
jgi:hypothetical protein